jgi:choline dehydrogenase
VLANRLSADGKNSVLLLEAGPKDSHVWIHVPLGYGRLFKEKTVNWMYQTEPEPGLDGRRVFQPRGKVLGGSSSINGLLYVRGQHEDYDRWRQRGNTGWGYDDVLPYFKKAENQERGADEFHGVGGPQPVSNLSHADPLSAAFIAAAVEAGIPRNHDFNGATQEGAGFFQTTTRYGRRASTAVAYLRPARGRSNLHVETAALAQRILFDGRRAGAIEYGKAGYLRTARARKEILVSSGAYNSPQLLQLSGVGPADLLRKHGIDVVLDAPGVGHDLQDHMQVRVVMRCAKSITLNDVVNSRVRRIFAGARYAAFRKGPLTIAAGTSGAFFKTNPRLATPDMQIHFLPFSTDKMGERLHSFSGFSASICQLRPESRGSLRIRSADPSAPPEIRINYLSTEVDRTANVEGLKVLRKILQAPALSPYVIEEVDPGVNVSSDEELLNYCRARGSTIYHPTSTCRMGSDPLAVVDQCLRVRGLEGLRVIDGSIMPDLVSGNTNAAIIMIAEKASDMILQDAR